MDAIDKVLKTINHEEPDRVPVWESAFTKNTISQYFGFVFEIVANQFQITKIFLNSFFFSANV
jgi:hypothetical protein